MVWSPLDDNSKKTKGGIPISTKELKTFLCLFIDFLKIKKVPSGTFFNVEVSGVDNFWTISSSFQMSDAESGITIEASITQ
jgi:hypothetical protein